MTDQVQSQENETQVRELTPAELEHVDAATGANILWADGSVRSAGAVNYQWLTHLDRG